MTALRLLFPVAILLSLLAGAVVYSAPVAPLLPVKLHKLLSEEMVAVNTASAAILGAWVAGDHAAVARQAQAIHDSFILERSLTPQDREALERALPPEFVALDTRFHARAAQLAAVARSGDAELEKYHFDRLTDTCRECHAHYATDRFPSLTQPAVSEPAHSHAH